MGEGIAVSDIRREYTKSGLDRDNLSNDPISQFTLWLEEAIAADVGDATSMTLATADADGFPSARIVLLKNYDHQGFSWFTNYDSEKGEQLAANPKAELLFYWPAFERQVRVRGRVEKVSREESVEYFHSRPLGSQLSAAASQQSQPIADRELLAERVEQLKGQYADQAVPCPDNWGGYRLIPERFEFWQGRESRLHDRFIFIQQGNDWSIERLQP